MRARPPGKFKAAVEAFEKNYLDLALSRNNRDALATAKEIGLGKSTMYRKMKAFGLTGSAPRLRRTPVEPQAEGKGCSSAP